MASFSDAGAGERVVFTKEQAKRLQTEKQLKVLTNDDESARIELMKKRLSVYGITDDTDEFISECIAEFCNGNPRETAKTVVDILLFRKE